MRNGALLLLLAVGCGPGPHEDLHRAVRHTAEAGESIAGPDPVLGGLPGGLGLVRTEQARQADLVVTADALAPAPVPEGWSRLWSSGGHTLWRRQREVGAPQVAVELEDLPGRIEDPPDLSPVRGWVQHGPASPGGELVVTAFLQPPARMSRRPCVSLRVEDQRYDLGVLLQGRGGFVPGAGPRPIVRHRARVPVPASADPGQITGQLRLHHCATGTDVSPPTPVPVQISASGRPSQADLTARPGTPDLDAEWADPRGRRYALRRKADGSIEQIPAPPMPRVERGTAFGLLVTPPLTPGPWGAPDGTIGPLTPLGPLFDEADAAVVHLAGSVSMQGESPDDHPVVRQRPEVLGHLTELDIDAVLYGPGVGIEGDRTAAHARSAGLWVDRVDVGDNDNAVGVYLLYGADLDAIVAGLETLPDDKLVLAAVPAGEGDAVELGRRLARSGVDGGWILDDRLGPVLIEDGVPVVAGLPDMEPVGRSVALRFYVAPRGVLRVDLVGLEGTGGRWQRLRDAGLKPDLERIAGLSWAHDVRVAVGQQVAAVSVTDHGPDRERRPATPFGLERSEPQPLPNPSLPDRCRLEPAELPSDAEPMPVGEGLVLRSHRLLDAQAGPDDPLKIELVWEASRPLPPGRLQWYAAGLPGTWRDSTAPCDGLWGFEDLEPGVLVRDVVRLFPPHGLPGGQATLQLGLRLGEERPRFGEGRFLDLGTVTVKGPPPRQRPSRPPSPDAPTPPTP